MRVWIPPKKQQETKHAILKAAPFPAALELLACDGALSQTVKLHCIKPLNVEGMEKQNDGEQADM